MILCAHCKDACGGKCRELVKPSRRFVLGSFAALLVAPRLALPSLAMGSVVRVLDGGEERLYRTAGGLLIVQALGADGWREIVDFRAYSRSQMPPVFLTQVSHEVGCLGRDWQYVDQTSADRCLS